MFIYFIVILILEIVFIILAKKEKKYFKIFNGLFFGFFVSIFLYYLYSYTEIFSYDTGEWVTLVVLIQSVFLSVLNLIIGVVGIISQKMTKKNQSYDISKKRETIKYIFLISFISFILIISQYMIRYHEKVKVENEIKKETMIYLKNKYGSSDFEIVEIYRDFAKDGFVGTDRLNNYDIYAIYIPKKIRFYIYSGVDSSRKIVKDSFNDRLISTGYSEEQFKDDDFIDDINKEIENLNIYLNEMELNANINLYSKSIVGLDNNKAVPNNYGKIPSKEELYNLILDYHIKHGLKIEIDQYEIQSSDLKSEIREYLINLSNYLINYYNGLDDYKIECHYSDKNGNFFNGRLIINKDYIYIDGNLMEEKIRR